MYNNRSLGCRDEEGTKGNRQTHKTHHNNELLKEMEKSLISLPDKCRLAFLLYKIRGQSYEEIALTLQISPSMVRKYVLRAVRHCYQQLQHEL